MVVCVLSLHHLFTYTNLHLGPESVFLGYPHGIKGYKVLDLDTNSVYISRDIVFYESIFPYASADSYPSTSYLTDFVFPHVTSDPSCTSDFHSSNTLAPSIPIDTSIPGPFATPNSVVSTLDPIPLKSTTHTSIPDPISDYDSVLAAIPTAQPIQPPLRRSTRPYFPPSYLLNYSCKTIVSVKPQSGLPYALSDFLSYSPLGPTFKSFVLAVNAAPSEPISFHQAI